ncbi:MAG: ATP-binding protein, partial [Candidatus Neoclostridium sp.]
MYYIDLSTGLFTELSSVDVVHDKIGASGDARARLNYFSRNMVAPEYTEEMLAFVELSTLDERMQNTRIVSKQYQSTLFTDRKARLSWRECSFIECDRGSDGRLLHVLFTTKSIHETKAAELDAQRRLKETNESLTALLEVEKQHTAIINSLGNVFFALYYIDIEQNVFREIFSPGGQDHAYGEKENAKLSLAAAVERYVKEKYRSSMRLFTDIDTVDERLGSQKMIIQEYVDVNGDWIRCSLFPVEKDASGKNVKIILGFRNVNEERERTESQDNLIRALAMSFENVYAVNMDTSTGVCYRMGQAIKSLYGQKFAMGDYETNLRLYVENEVLPDDRSLFDGIRSVKEAAKLFAQKHTHSFTYRVLRDDRVQYFECQLVKPDDRRNEFAIGFKNVDSERQKENKNRAIQDEQLRIIGALSQEYSSLFKIDAKTRKMTLFRTDGIAFDPVLLDQLLAIGDYEEILSKYIDAFVIPEDRERMRESVALPVLLEKVPPVGLYKLGYRRIKNGTVAYFEMNTAKIADRDGTVTFILGLRDVDEEARRQMRQTREMEQQREIIEGLGSEYYSVLLVNPVTDSVAIFRADSDDGKAIAEHFHKHGYCWSKGLSGYAEENVSPSCREDFMKKLSLEHIREDGEDYSLTYEKLTEEGIIYLQARVAFVQEKNGGCVAVVGTRNVDDLIKKERQQETALQAAYDSAEAANKAKTEFLSNMSHDIRTPMNGIIGMTAIAATHLDDKERVRDSLQKISQASKHMLSLINEVLDMSKIESGKVDLIEEEFNLSNLIDNLLSMTNEQISRHRHELSVNISGVTHEEVIGDSLRIQKVFTNLMSNAVKYTPDGGKISLTIVEKPSSYAKVGCFEFIFEDNGIGMSEEYQKKIFEPFTRASDSRVHKIQGTGLGMPISRNIVRMMGGDIKVESKLDVGSRFTVTMYLKLQDSVAEEHEKFADLNVLVADDDRISLESCCGMLEDLGMKPYGV